METKQWGGTTKAVHVSTRENKEESNMRPIFQGLVLLAGLPSPHGYIHPRNDLKVILHKLPYKDGIYNVGVLSFRFS